MHSVNISDSFLSKEGIVLYAKVFRRLMLDTARAAVGQWFGSYWRGQEDHGPLTKAQCWASFTAPCHNNRPPRQEDREIYIGCTVAFNRQWWSHCTTQGSRTFIDISSLFILCTRVNQGCTSRENFLILAYFLVSIVLHLHCTPTWQIFEFI